MNVGCVAEALIAGLPPSVRDMLPPGASTLAALHDVGKVTLGFQAKCPQWLAAASFPTVSPGALSMTVSDHALVSQVFLQRVFTTSRLRLWAVAVGAHHGRPKGKNVQLLTNAPEALHEWAEDNRRLVQQRICTALGPLPVIPPKPELTPYHSDLWLLAGLITVADWIGSNETWFPPDRDLGPDEARARATGSVRQIGWPGGGLRRTTFAEAFTLGSDRSFEQNAVQKAVEDASGSPGVVIVEGPMGCGKTEAALFAAQRLISSGAHQGFYFALPTQVTSNRIHRRVEHFLRNSLAGDARLRLAHANAWLDDDFDLKLRPAFRGTEGSDGSAPELGVREARSWFASPKHALLAPYGVGTIDQALQGVVSVKHFFVRRFALAGKVVILDEIHSYDVYTGTLVAALVRELVNLRCSVIILSATLTAARRRELLAAAGVEEPHAPDAYPLITTAPTAGPVCHISPARGPDRRVALRAALQSEESTIEELIRRAEKGQHVLWIRNTVIEAQAAFRAIRSTIRQGDVRLGLLHSRFPFARRSELEDDWLERLGRNRPLGGTGSILVATQVVEQSVDIDLDFIVTDLAPTDMMLQRLGRLWRHPRHLRPADQPEFWVRLPDLSGATTDTQLKTALGRSARVYAPYVLLRTHQVWATRSEIQIPSEIRPLLEATYCDPEAGEPGPWQELHAELEAEKRGLEANANAATLVLGRPAIDDDEEVLTRRRGSPTIPVVLLRSATLGPRGLTRLTALDGSTIEVSDFEWRREAASFLHSWLVRAPRWFAPTGAPKPRWLALHMSPGTTVATVDADDRCLFGDISTTTLYCPTLGLHQQSKPQTPCQRQEDDEDEFDF